MGVKETVKQQYRQQVNLAASQVAKLSSPKEGWIAFMRKSLGMSALQLAVRAGVSKPAVYQAQRNELRGAISINQMKKLAEALGCRFVFAIVPDGKIEDVIKQQAYKKAQQLVRRASAHMALEQQSLTDAQIQAQIEQLADEMIQNFPADFWGE